MGLNSKMRAYHRYLGFFLAGVMAIYAVSGIAMIFRDTNFLKVEKHVEKQLVTDITPEELGRELRIRDFRITKTEANILYFEQGTFDTTTGIARYRVKDLPYLLGKLTRLHKATSNSPLFFMNVFFGLSLLFFVISSFWMFLPGSKVFTKGLYFTLAGSILAILMIFI